MGRLSNFLKKHDPAPPPPANNRPVEPAEIAKAVRLILGTNARNADEGQVLDFLRYSVERGMNVNDIWVADRAGAIAWAVMPVISPGHTMLLLLPGHWPYRATDPTPRHLINDVCSHYGSRGMKLAQCLLDPADNGARAVLEPSGFAYMAELHYLQATVRKAIEPPTLPAGYTWQHYSPTTHDLFGQTIARTYHGSLDCPALNGLRDMEDIIAGHKSSGEFDPNLWLMLCHDDTPLGVLLLARLPRHDAVELVYIGLTPDARGLGLGDLLVRQALSVVSEQKLSRLSLAVDSRNTPALSLYFRHGLQHVGQKAAMMRPLSADALKVDSTAPNRIAGQTRPI